MANAKDYVAGLTGDSPKPKVVSLVSGLHGTFYALDDAGHIFEYKTDDRDPFRQVKSWRRIQGPAENPYKD